MKQKTGTVVPEPKGGTATGAEDFNCVGVAVASTNHPTADEEEDAVGEMPYQRRDSDSPTNSEATAKSAVSMITQMGGKMNTKPMPQFVGSGATDAGSEATDQAGTKLSMGSSRSDEKPGMGEVSHTDGVYGYQIRAPTAASLDGRNSQGTSAPHSMSMVTHKGTSEQWSSQGSAVPSQILPSGSMITHKGAPELTFGPGTGTSDAVNGDEPSDSQGTSVAIAGQPQSQSSNAFFTEPTNESAVTRLNSMYTCPGGTGPSLQVQGSTGSLQGSTGSLQVGASFIPVPQPQTRRPDSSMFCNEGGQAQGGLVASSASFMEVPQAAPPTNRLNSMYVADGGQVEGGPGGDASVAPGALMQVPQLQPNRLNSMYTHEGGNALSGGASQSFMEAPTQASRGLNSMCTHEGGFAQSPAASASFLTVGGGEQLMPSSSMIAHSGGTVVAGSGSQPLTGGPAFNPMNSMTTHAEMG